MCLFASHTNVQASVILPVCVFLTIVRPFVRRPVSSDVHLLWSAHLRVIMKATFDFNLSWNLLLLSQVTLSSRLAHVLLFLFLQVPLSQNRANSTAAAVQKWHFSKVGQSLAKVTQGLDYNTPFFSDRVFMALWIFTLNPIWITLCKASLETTHQHWHLKKKKKKENVAHLKQSWAQTKINLRMFWLVQKFFFFFKKS